MSIVGHFFIVKMVHFFEILATCTACCRWLLALLAPHRLDGLYLLSIQSHITCLQSEHSIIGKIKGIHSNYYSNFCLQVFETTSDEELQEIASLNYSCLVEAGFIKPTTLIRISDKEEIIRALTLHHTLLKSLSEVDQFGEGLRSSKVLDVLRRYSRYTKSFFTLQGRPPISSGE